LENREMPVSNIIELPPKSEVESQLKELLRDFQRGQIIALAVVGVVSNDDRDTEYMIHIDGNAYTLLGAIESCKSLVVDYIKEEFHQDE